MRTAPIAMESTLPVRRLMATNRARWVACCGTKRAGLDSGPRPVRIQANISSRYSGPWRIERSTGEGQRANDAVAQTATAAAQHNMATTAPRRSPRESSAAMTP
jgi:hypothetical protein